MNALPEMVTPFTSIIFTHIIKFIINNIRNGSVYILNVHVAHCIKCSNALFIISVCHGCVATIFYMCVRRKQENIIYSLYILIHRIILYMYFEMMANNPCLQMFYKCACFEFIYYKFCLRFTCTNN